MRIMIVAPRSITGHFNNQTPFRFDYTFWNFFMPLSNIGNVVHFFDTQVFGEKDFEFQFESFKPELLFCVMTGNKLVTPNEPWEQIKKVTESGVCKTFNWYCDDSWRFDDFSSKTCEYFHFCSTTERRFMEKYKQIGYSNIRYANWHSNPDAYSTVSCKKRLLAGFIGALNGDRINFLNQLAANDINVGMISNAPFEEMIHLYSSCLVGLNFTKSASDNKRQMKARIFEIPATRTMLLTEYVDGIEEFFDIETEIMTFNEGAELVEKVKWAAQNPEKAFNIAAAGHRRFMMEHTSQLRLTNLLGTLV